MFKSSLDQDLATLSAMIILMFLTMSGYSELSSLLFLVIGLAYLIFKLPSLKVAKIHLVQHLKEKIKGPISIVDGKFPQQYQKLKNFIKTNSKIENIGTGFVNKVSGTLNYFTMKIIKILPWLFCCIPAPTKSLQILYFTTSILVVGFLTIVMAWSNSNKIQKPPIFSIPKLKTKNHQPANKNQVKKRRPF